MKFTGSDGGFSRLLVAHALLFVGGCGTPPGGQDAGDTGSSGTDTYVPPVDTGTIGNSDGGRPDGNSGSDATGMDGASMTDDSACAHQVSDCGPGGPAPGSRMCRMVGEHNRVRCAATPRPSTPLRAVRWSEELAQHAREWASQCQQQHYSNLGALGEGENWRSWSRAGSLTDVDVVRAWADDEAVHYNYESNTCAVGEQCGHYTQVVWHDTLEIGCAVQECPMGFPQWSGGREIWFCRYRRPGNYNGQRPY